MSNEALNVIREAREILELKPGESLLATIRQLRDDRVRLARAADNLAAHYRYLLRYVDSYEYDRAVEALDEYNKAKP